MKIIGFNFTKIHAEKNEKRATISNIKSNIDISDVSSLKSDFLSQNKGIVGIKFSYSIEYEPEFAQIVLAGIIVLSLPQEDSKEIIDKWKDKQIPEKYRVPLFNMILKKVTLKSLQMEEELALPHHIQMPFLKSEKESTPQ